MEDKLTETARRRLEEMYALQADAIRDRLTHRVGREAADDIVGRAFTRLAEKLTDEPAKDAPALLGLIVSGLLKNYYRDQAALREREMLVGGLPEIAALTDDGRRASRGITYEDHDFAQGFDAAVRDLDDVERDAFILTELRGLSDIEAAGVLGTSRPTVQRRREAARHNIREELIAA